MSNPAIKRALEYENYFSKDNNYRKYYEMREDAIRDENSRLIDAITQGISQGISTTKHKNAINLLKLGVDIDTIAKGVDLSVDEVKAIQKEL